MNSLRQPKQLKLNLGPLADEPTGHSFEEFIASHLCRKPDRTDPAHGVNL